MSTRSNAVSAVEQAPRLLRVASNLFAQRDEAGKSLLVAQFGHELDLDLAAIQVGREIEYMGFEQPLHPRHRRAGAKARHTRQRCGADPVHPYREDPRD